MRKADIVVGEEYASGRSDRGYMTRVRVLEVGVERQVGHRWDRKIVTDGVRVVLLYDSGEEVLETRWDEESQRRVPPDEPRVKVITTRQIHRTWAAEEGMRKRKKERDAQAETARLEREARREKLQAALQPYGASYVGTGHSEYHVSVPMDVLERVMRRLEDLEHQVEVLEVGDGSE